MRRRISTRSTGHYFGCEQKLHYPLADVDPSDHIKQERESFENHLLRVGQSVEDGAERPSDRDGTCIMFGTQKGGRLRQLKYTNMRSLARNGTKQSLCS
jgi:hypothetical protein